MSDFRETFVLSEVLLNLARLRLDQSESVFDRHSGRVRHFKMIETPYACVPRCNNRCSKEEISSFEYSLCGKVLKRLFCGWGAVWFVV